MNTDIDISNIRKMDGGLLLVLQQLLEHGSVTRTAASLKLGQSTISHSLARLRELFNDPLFIRKPHGLEPTQRAIQLKPKIETLLDLTQQALDIGQSFSPEASERLFYLSAPEFVTVTTATSLLHQIAKQAPAVGVKFLHLSEADIFERLRRGEIEGAIGRFDQSPAELKSTLLYEDEFCIVCRRGHPISKGKMSELKYRNATHIWADSPSETISIDSDMDFTGIHGSIVPRWLTALVIAAQSDYIATCPRRLAESQADLFNLDILNFTWPAPIRLFLTHRHDFQDRGAEWFIQQIRDVFE